MRRLISLLFLLITLIFGRTEQAIAYQYDFAVCSLFRDEARFLKEWIEFHRLLGVQHFYLYNHLSNDEYLEVLEPYISEGIVELHDIYNEPNNVHEWHSIQIWAYNDALEKARGKVKWLAILDSDEFLFPTHENNLPGFFKRYESMAHIGGVCVNWVMFGTSHVAKIPEDKLMIETLTLCEKKGYDHFKSIVRPERVAYCCSAHYCIYKEGVIHCTAENTLVLPPFVHINNIRINHYWTRDEKFFYNVKVPRRMAWGTPYEACMGWLQMYNIDYDNTISRFIKPLRKRVFHEIVHEKKE